MELDFTAVETQLAAANAGLARLNTAWPKVQTGVAVLKAENEALRAALPNAQTRLNQLAGTLGQMAQGLATTADGVEAMVAVLPTIPPPTPPGG